MSPKKILPLALLALFCWSGTLFAQYTLVLKNGRRITVQSYREEGGMIKFYGLGGEIGIAKNQIATILQPGEKEEQGMVIQRLESGPSRPAAAPREEKAGEADHDHEEPAKKEEPAKPQAPEATPRTAGEKLLTPEESRAQQRAEEEQAYQKKVRELTERLKSARDRYLMATRGSSGPEPTLLRDDQAIQARTQDLMSRLRDAQHNPGGPSDAGGVSLSTPPAFSGSPPSTTELRPGGVAPRVDTPLPNYTDKEKELSEMRNQIYRLEKERETVIQEMKQKNFETGSLFIE